ncbi:MAG TPA: hypothetical protein VKV39_13620 [Candidatus Sulfotelmatobacter sp.]|nr:hypothetical protein [Candidatus Sulfotelmatobacter sp.]
MLASASVLNLVLVLAMTGTPRSAPAQAAGGTHSPHGNLNIPCQNCHTASAWKPIRAVPEFDHNQTKYPLRGMHTSVACIQCHVKPVFSNVGQRCQDCHADIHRRQLGANCEQCHTVRGWQVTVQQIQNHNNRFPLTGAHAAVDCDACHKNAANSQFQTMPTDCYSCHEADYLGTTNPKHSPQAFPIENCQGCHSTDNWLNAKFDHSATGFPLTGMHTVPPRQCVDCHVNNNYALSSTACFTCHQADYAGTTNPKHTEQEFPDAQCSQCHNTTSWANASFDHSTTGFPLTGAHTVPPRQCIDCHVNNNYTLSTGACVSCHLKDFQGTTNPNHVAGGFAETCDTCHTTTAWQPATFDHSKTAFPLTGSHTVPPRQCTDCHVNNNYNLTNTTCVSCHQTDYNNATSPVAHAAAGFPTTCQQCHDTVQWSDGVFNHSSTGFNLTGAHTVPPRACTDCHTNNNYSLNSTACVTCHLADYNGTTNPNHVTANFPQTCDQCHGTSTWSNAAFNHNNTGFPLTGSHTVPPRVCTDCHVNNNYTITNTACVSCHQTDYNNATSPVAHASAGFPTTCEQCHDTVAWTDGTFNHASTGFTLTGAHTVPPRVCADCHVNNNYNLNSTACVTCHLADYNGTTNPNHVTANFPQTCDQCHSTSSWTSATFNHNNTGFPLTGAHTVPPRACTDCHVNNNYNLTSAACVTCHLADYNGTTNPNHVTANFPQTCDTCHSTSTWANATFNHNSTGFPLTGSHTVPPRVCTDCHVNNNYNITNTTCVSCHQTDYNNATTPVAHASAGFPTTCEQCHDTVAWTDGTFNHASTGFTLTGSHTVPPRLCSDCHVNNNYNITTTTCVSCHQTDYNNATTPVNHVAANFPTTCDQCHDTVQWTDGTFNHASTGFTLTGAHTVPPRACTDCHKGASPYSLNSTACVTCHLTDYNGTTNPNHVTAGFPQQCDLCHDTTVWTDSTFNHNNTAFPLTGSHTVPPRQCTDCHVNGNYTTLPTTCVGCHQTDYNNTTNPGHSAQPQFFPTTCATCHNTTAWTGATFNHTQYTPFPTTHGSANGVCATCHTNSNDYSVFQCTGCHGGNNAANFHHENVPGYVYNSVNCYQCHQSGHGD